MSSQYSEYVQMLRDRQIRKAESRSQPERMRHIALAPVEEFAESLATAGEISSFRVVEDRFVCSILVCSQMRNLLSSGGSIQVTCNFAHPARTSGHTFWGIAIEAIGCKPRFITGTNDYRELFHYLVACIADQKLAVMTEQ